MKKKFVLAAGIAAIAVALFATARAQQPSVEAPHAMKIGIVDLTRAVSEYRHRSALEKELKDLKEELDRQDSANEREFRKLGEEIDQLAMGSPDRMELESRAKRLAAEAENFRRTSFQKLNARYAEMIKQLFDEIQKEVQALAIERGYDMVIKDQSAEADLPQAALQQVSQRVVLFCKPEYDLTNDVIARLNAQYQSGKTPEAAKDEQPKPATTPSEERKP